MRFPAMASWKHSVYILVIVCLLGGCLRVDGQLLTTVAGTGAAGFSGDGGQALSAQFTAPISLCLDGANNMYIADYNNHRIRKFNINTGIVTTIAGNGTAGFSGDGGNALLAQLNQPTGLCLDKAGHLYFSDYSNLRVRRVDLSTGIITTVAGNGTENYINGGVAILSGMLPHSLAMDHAGNLFISQHPGPFYTLTTNIISKLDMSTGVITTIAGTGMPGFSGDGGPALAASFWFPAGLAFDASDNLYVADAINNRVRKIDAATGIVTTMAGSGGSNFFVPDGSPAVNLSFKNVLGVFADGAGNLIITDESDERIRKVNLATGLFTTLAGNGYISSGPDCVPPTSTGLNDPTSACTDASGILYFNELASNRIRKVYVAAPAGGGTVTITNSTGNYCPGDMQTFTATVTGATGPFTYQWQVNGQSAGGNTTIFTSTALNNGDMLTCTVIPSVAGNCVTGSPIVSKPVAVAVNPLVSPQVTIATASTTVCSGAQVSFTATPTGGGANPVYQWRINNNSVGTNSPVFTTTTLADKDVVQCQLTTDPAEKCVATPVVLSAAIVMVVSAMEAPTVSISASGTTICPGDSVVFLATSQQAGASPSYQWLLNGVISGQTGAAYGNAHLINGDQVSCRMTANNAACATSQPVLSNTEIISVRTVPVIDLPTTDTTILPGQQIILPASVRGNVQSWQWEPAADLTNPSSLTPLTIPMVETTIFQLEVFSTDGCSVKKNLLVNVFYKLVLPGAFTPNGDGKNDLFRIPPGVTMQLKDFSVFDRWGVRVFSTKNSAQGWDGSYKGMPCAPGTYVFTVSGSNSKGSIFSTGTVILLR